MLALPAAFALVLRSNDGGNVRPAPVWHQADGNSFFGVPTSATASGTGEFVRWGPPLAMSEREGRIVQPTGEVVAGGFSKQASEMTIGRHCFAPAGLRCSIKTVGGRPSPVACGAGAGAGVETGVLAAVTVVCCAR